MPEDLGTQLGLGGTPIPEIVINVVQLVLGVATFVTLIMLMAGALRWVVTGSNEEFRERAKQTILNALFGQILIIVAWAIVSFVAQIFLDI